jgi:DNA topoisomerase-1
VKLGRFGPMAQIGEADDENKPKFAGLRKGQSLDTIKLEEAIDLFKLPRTIGTFEDVEVSAAIGRFGPYLKHKSAFYSLAKTDDPMTVTIERGIEIINEKRLKDSQKVIKQFKENEEVFVLNGRWGAYIAIGKENYKIPKTTQPETLTLEDCLKIAKEAPPSKPKRSFKKTKK